MGQRSRIAEQLQGGQVCASTGAPGTWPLAERRRVAGVAATMPADYLALLARAGLGRTNLRAGRGPRTAASAIVHARCGARHERSR